MFWGGINEEGRISDKLPNVPLNDSLSTSSVAFLKLDALSDTFTWANNVGTSSLVSLIFDFGTEFLRSGVTVLTKTCLGSFCDSVCGVSNFGITLGRSVKLICFVKGNVNGFSILA